MKYCPKCGYGQEGNFCPNCGEALQKEPPLRCPKCQTRIIPYQKFCSNCGTKVKEVKK